MNRCWLSKEVLSLLSISECVSSPSGAAGVIDRAHGDGDAGCAALPRALGPLTQAGAGRGSASRCRRGRGPGGEGVDLGSNM